MSGRVFLLLCLSSACPAFAYDDLSSRDKNYPLISDCSPLDGLRISLETNLNTNKHGDANELVSGLTWQVTSTGHEALDWGLDFVMSREIPEPGKVVYNPSAHAMFSFAPNDALTLTANASFADRENESMAQSWGLEAGYRWTERWSFVAKTYGHGYENPAKQLGFTYAFSSAGAEFELLYGQQTDNDQGGRWASLGLRLDW